MVLVIYYLETYIGSIVDWKHQTDWNHTKSLGKKVHQKHSFGNNEIRLETQSGVSKQSFVIKSTKLNFQFFVSNRISLFSMCFFVSDIISLFKMYFFVSSRFFRCQSKLVPIYVSKLHTCTTHGPSEMNISPIRALSVKITQVQAP